MSRDRSHDTARHVYNHHSDTEKSSKSLNKDRLIDFHLIFVIQVIVYSTVLPALLFRNDRTSKRTYSSVT